MTRRTGPSDADRRRAVAVALAALLALAGCAGVGAPGDAGARTVNPSLAETPTATPTAPTPAGGFPPGVSRDGVEVERLIDGHRSALTDGADAWSVSLTRTVTGPAGTVERSAARVTVEGNRSLYTFERVRGENRLASAHWSNASASASRRVSWRGDVTLEGRPGDPGAPVGLDPTGGAWLYASSVDTRPEYVGTRETPNGTVTLIEAAEGRIERSGLPDRRRVRLSATVDERGVVRSLTLRYAVFLGTDPGTVAVRLRVRDVGTTTVPRPPWVADALANATAEGDAAGD
ncbi:DUF7537 family lipoprotein [Halobaculum lipolyticum]|uniref:Outer membrane lipoprotein-sorting protein n=1 Tax=Halobaculum lipolyticum TaxID=3032001 RepID=A0ABD5W9C9_9EURY|nr:hypothetical protein [Halobaculum sp. DT31]